MRKISPFLSSLAGVLVVEAGVLVVFGIVLLVEMVLGRSGSVGVSVFLLLCCAGAAWALLAAGRAVRSGARLARGLIVTWQLFQVLVGVTAIASGASWAVAGGVAALVLAVAAVALLFSRPVLAATTRRP